ncbi:acetyltransferase [Sphingomonas sp. Sph1(2015)]|jgi:N-hydroxyarylamine O-acetyltransferase|uniref:arylamine N-acetyltransferase family protein n=1 Tax=Sphingomonas sp. Sph1(2015) TaxID=1628084 RepID=UPI0009767B9C|nr:arylamine N-acetyltransferase [Sphingomonas sp. Sph1(2015)]OMJ33686.1 acetyltransferase [Sphingomonas sp. Sph1(2015)]
MFNLDSYLARIALPSRVTVDAEGLGRLQWAHRQAIPFENIDVRLGRPIAIDSTGVFAKLVTAKRGGYCFEQNRLFLDALAAHGFHARPLLARVWLAATDVPPTTHTLSLVHIEGQDWIADAGFGGSYLPPMPLVEGAEATAPDGALFRLDRDPQHGWMLLRNGHPGLTDGRATGEGWQPQYSFTTDHVWDADLALANHWTSTAPESRFRQATIVSIVLPRGFAALTDRHYRRRVGEDEAAATITDPRVYRMRLSLMFGIDLGSEDAGTLFGE